MNTDAENTKMSMWKIAHTHTQKVSKLYVGKVYPFRSRFLRVNNLFYPFRVIRHAIPNNTDVIW